MLRKQRLLMVLYLMSKKDNIAITLKNERAICNLIFLVFNGSKPYLINHGAITIKPNKFLKRLFRKDAYLMTYA